MDENLHDIEDLFRSALEDYGETPDKNVWEAVDKRLDKDNIVSIKRKYTNLKRIAILLLFLSAGFALFDLYKINTPNNSLGLAKNNQHIHTEYKKNPENVSEKFSDKKAATNAAKITDTNNILDSHTENAATENTINDNNKSNNKQQAVLINIQPLQKQNKVLVTGSVKDILKGQTSLTAHQRKKLNTKPSYRVKIINAAPDVDEQLLVQHIDGQVDNQIKILRELKNISIENMKFQLKDSNDTKKILEPITAVKTKVSDTRSTNAVAKTVKNKQGKPAVFSVTPFFSPDIAWYRLQDDKVANQSDNAAELEKEENHGFSSTFGVLVDYKINKHWSLQSGFTLSNINITLDPKTIYAKQDYTGSFKYRINTSSGYGYVLPSFSANPVAGDSLYAFTSTHSLKYAGIPLAVNYSIIKGKFKVNTMAGIAANILRKAKLETTVEKDFNNETEVINNIEGLKKVYFSGLAGVGVDYNLTKKTAFTFEPTLRFALNSINKDAPVKSYPMSFGFAIGLKIGL